MEHTSRCIAFFTRYLPNMGGVEVFTDNLAKELTAEGQRCIVITTDSDETGLERDFPIIRIPSKNLLGGRLPIPSEHNVETRIIEVLRKHEVTNVVINGRFYPLSRLGAKAARSINITPIVIDHSSSYVADPHSLQGASLALADHIASRLLNIYSPDYYCVSKVSSDWIQTFGLSSSGEIHNAINAAEFRNNASNYLLPKGQNGSLKIMYAARLIPEKGILNLVEAAIQLNESVELYVAGDGPLHDDLIKASKAHPNIHFLGRLNHPDLSSALLQADAFCFPTKYGEGLPTCLLEAGACSCALITTHTGGTAEIIPNDQYGIVLDEATVDSITVGIKQLIDNPSRLKSLQHAIRNHIEKTFSWANTVQELLSAIEQIGL